MVKTMFTRITCSLGILAMLIAISCDRVPLLAPTNSSVTLDAGSRVVETGGSTSLSAMVIEPSGTPVQNGTTVRFTTTLGRVDPVEAQTRNGVATTTFFAGDASGIAEVRATSGGAGGSSTTPTTPPSNGENGTTTTTSTNSNVVLISVGAGAVNTVTVTANPSTVSRTTNTPVTIIARVVAAGGRLLSGVPVSFSANRGTFSSTSVTTDAQGEARVTLTTNDTTTVTAVAGTVKAEVQITGQDGPAVSLTCTVGGTAGCATVSQGQTVVFSAARGAASSNIVSSTLDFGDGSSVNLGPLSTSATSVPHTYNQAGTFTARLTATDVNGESASATQVVQVSAATATVTTTKSGLVVTASATVSAPVSQYVWTWGDNTGTTTTTSATAQHTYAAAGTYPVSVTATLQSGGTVTASTSVAVP
jgi:hypothetical protein